MFVLIFALVSVSASAMTFDVGNNKIDLYASVRGYAVFNHTGSGIVDRTIEGQKVLWGVPISCGGSADVYRNCKQIAIGLQDNSRAGIRWTQGDFFVNNEWGITNVGETTAQLRLRYLYADYKIDGGAKGRIRFGQLPGIVHTAGIYDSKLNADNALAGYGTMTEARRIGINYEIGDISISLISMRQDRAAVTGLFTTNFSNVAFMEIMPRIEAAYKVTPSVTVAGTYVKSSVTANYTDPGATTNAARPSSRYYVNAGHIMATANPEVGNNIRLLASGFYSMNGGLYDMVYFGGGQSDNEAVSRTAGFRAMPVLKRPVQNAAGNVSYPKAGEMNNASVYGGAFGVLIDKFEAGFGIQSGGRDDFNENINTMGFYANYKHRVSIFRITPEVRYLNSGNHRRTKPAPGAQALRDEDKMKNTRGLQVGVQFRMDI